MELLLLKEISKALRVSNAQIWGMVRRGELPPPLKLGAMKRAWLRSDVDEFLNRLASQRVGGQGQEARP